MELNGSQRYHLIMRRAVFYVLILLTALRGLVGDAMAVEMVRMHGSLGDATTHVVQATVQEKASFPCHEPQPVNSEQSSQAAPECTSCQVCHSPVLQRIGVLPELSRPLADGVASAQSPWVSADIVQAQKPPIF